MKKGTLWITESLIPQKSLVPMLNQLGLKHMDYARFQDMTPEEVEKLGTEHTVIFHGSQEVADQLAKNPRLTPGAFCATDKFLCTSWYPGLREHIVNSDYHLTTVKDLVGGNGVAKFYGDLYGGKIFVRPDSPLKPFSGRVLDTSNITLESLDHGYYYNSVTLDLIVAPVQEIGREWRFVMAYFGGLHRVLGVSGYDKDRNPISPEEAPLTFALEVALKAQPLVTDLAYVLDIAEVGGELKVMELNPFSGASLYSCDLKEVIPGVTEAAEAASYLALIQRGLARMKAMGAFDDDFPEGFAGGGPSGRAIAGRGRA